MNEDPGSTPQDRWHPIAPEPERAARERPDLADRLRGALADRYTVGLLTDGSVPVVPTPTALQASRYVADQVARDAALDPVAALAREAGARMVVSGSYRLEGGDVVFSVTVVDASPEPGTTGFRQSIQERGPGDAPMQTIEAMRGRVMSAFALESDDRVEVTRAPAYEAYRTFSRGLEAYIDRDFRRAIPLLREAFERGSPFPVHPDANFRAMWGDPGLVALFAPRTG